jgi:hypothetical protein
MAIKWGPWESLGRPLETEVGRPFVQRNQDGRLEVFAIGQGEIFNIPQVAPNGRWSDTWRTKGRPSSAVRVKLHVVGRNADGRQEIFALGDDNALWQKWQVAPNDGWSEWKTLDTPAKDNTLTGQFTVGRNQDGRQEIFAVGSDGNVWQIWQTAPNGGWSNWGKLGRPVPGIRGADRLTVGRNKDGRQELFVMGGDDALWHVWQVAPNLGWTAWESLRKPKDPDLPEPKDRDISEPLVRENADGHLEVFAPGNGAFCNRWQEAPNSTVWRHQGWNAKPQPRSTVGLTWLEAALNFENRIEALGFGDDGALWQASQIDVAPNWSGWQSLAAPPAKIRQADRLSVGTNQDGRLDAFVVGQDGAVWHIAQTR